MIILITKPNSEKVNISHSLFEYFFVRAGLFHNHRFNFVSRKVEQNMYLRTVYFQMATKRIRNYQRMREFLEGKQLYIPGMSYDAMRQAEAEYLNNLDEDQIIKSSLESMGLFEKGMSSNEAKELYSTLNESLQDSNVQQEMETDYEESIELAISESEKEFCRNSTMLNSIEDNLSWEHFDLNDAEKSTNCNEIIVKADVHHEFDWDPEEDLRRKIETIALNESKQNGKQQERSDSGIITDYRSLDFIEVVDPAIAKKENQFPCKRKTSFTS